MSYFEFPHTRTYDSDLGWLIKHVGENITNISYLQKWAAEHQPEYEELLNKVNGLIDNLIDVIVPWDSSVAYRVFTIAEYQGTNYIALQDVPVGIMITNQDYWQPANTVLEQLNAIAVTVSDINRNKVDQEDIIFGVQRPAMICSNTIRGNVKIREFAGSENYENGFRSMQAACYLEASDELIIGIIKGSTGEAILAKVNASDMSVIDRTSVLPLGHVNDMTYNNDTGTIFLATGNDGNYSGKIVEIDQNMTVINSYELGITNWCISYDSVTDKYYVIADEGFYRYNNDFTIDTELPYDLGYVGNGTIRIQGSAFIDGNFYVMTYTEDGTLPGYMGANIIGINPDGLVISSMHYPLADASDEPETMYERNNKVYILSGQSWFRVYEMAKDTRHTMEDRISYNTSRVTLANGTDLDTLFTPGIYQTVNGAGTLSLLNEPANGYSSASVKVEIIRWFNIKQTFTVADNNSWTRSYDTASGTWSAWEKVSDRSIVATTSETIEIATATSTVVATIALPAKKAIMLEATVTFPTNASGRRMLSIDGAWKSSANAVAGDSTRLTATSIIENRSNAARNVSVRAYQNSGNALNTEVTINYMFI